ncbi:hypothetical protein D3C74_464650 [compost metagenome]
MFGPGDVDFVIDGHETGEFAIDANQERLGGRVTPIADFRLDREKTVLGELQRQPFAEVVHVELHEVFDDIQLIALSGVQFDIGHAQGSCKC